ncbi:MAG: hypothetical protein ACYTEZ_14570 [Planctomycetota bacterium]|jgi:hypothetical protein
MEDTPAYLHFKSRRRLPEHVSYACKRKDVDACLETLEIAPPFHELHFGLPPGPPALSPRTLPRELPVAEASSSPAAVLRELYDRRVTRSLTIETVPSSLAHQVRKHLRSDGLPKLMRWLQGRGREGETARARKASLRLTYCVEEDRLRTEQVDERP